MADNDPPTEAHDDYPPGVEIEDVRLDNQCRTCLHRRFGTTGCAAFPDGIPTAILLGHFDHRFPYPGDGGIRYSRRPES